MESIIFIRNLEGDEPHVLELIETFKKNIKVSINIIKVSQKEQEIISACHTLKGYFKNKTLQQLLRNGQKSKDIKKNINKIENRINIELEKLN